MALQAGIVGLPNVGKSTLFNALSNAKAQAANFPFCTIEPNVGVITVPDERLFELEKLVNSTRVMFDLLLEQSENYKSYLLPGYTHLQLAMPSSFGLWFGAYAESLVDDIITVHAAYELVNKNPLGSAAGYGSSFPINRRLTTDLLGFDDLNYKHPYLQYFKYFA